MKKLLLLFALIIIISSCERVIDLKIPAHEKKLVMNAQWAQGRFFTARVSRSWGFTETFNNLNEQFKVRNAFVTVKENGVIVDTLKYDSTNDRYSSNRRRVTLAKTYIIEASAPGFEQVSGTSEIPYVVKPSAVTVKRAARIGVNGQPEAEVTITFKDSSVINYYILRVRSQDGSFAFCVKTNDRDLERIGASDPFETNICLEGDKLLFPDRNFNGREKKIILYLEDYLLEPVVNPPPGRTQRAWIEMLHVNEDYFRYIKSVRNSDDTQGNPFAEPVNVVNNIKNGYGFFTTYAIAVDTLR